MNLAGEVLPPLYIFDSKAKEEDKFSVDPSIGIGLPEVEGVFGLYEKTCFAPYFAIRRKGSMDTSLWSQFNETVILNCFPRCSNAIVRCPLTNKLLQGPVIIKTDAGPGRLSKEAASWQFRERMHEKGLIIMLGLPNGTSATQEMDQGYTDYKQECKKSTLRVASIKLAARNAARQSRDEVVVSVDGADDNANHVSTRSRKSVCNVTLGNEDLANIINGFPGDPIDLRPFDKVFTQDNIKSWWKNVGFLPMTRNAVNDPKTRWELGEGGAPEEGTARLVILVDDYNVGAKKVEEMGFNKNILSLRPPVVSTPKIPEGEEAQIQALVDGKAINKAGAMFKLGLQVANSRVMLEANKRMVKLEEEAKANKERKKKKESEGKDQKAIEAFNAWITKGKCIDTKGHPVLNKDDSLSIIKVLLPKIAPTEKVGDYKTMKKCNEWLGNLAGGSTWEEEMKAIETQFTESILARSV